MKRITAILLSVILIVACGAGCGKAKEPDKNQTAITKREKPLEYGINAHIFELRPVMDPSSTMDYVTDMVGVLGVTYYRLSTPLDSMFLVGEGDTLVFRDGYRNLIHQVIKKMKAAGIKCFVAVSDGPVYPYGYEVSCPGVVPDPLVEKDMYIRWLKLYGKAWGMIAEEFPEITHVECMNEPDHPTGNSFTKQGHQWAAEDGYMYEMDDKAHMVVDMLYYVTKEVRAVNSKASVTTPGLTNFNEAHDFLDNMYEAIESGAHPTGEDFGDVDPDHYFQCIDFHDYQNGRTAEEYFKDCDEFYKACERHNDAGKPAILSEWGYTDQDNEGLEQKNGEDLTELMKVFDEKMPYLEAVLLYVMNDFSGYSVSIAEDNFGIFTSHGDPDKPSFPKPTAISFYKYIHKTDDVSPLYKYCPELMPK